MMTPITKEGKTYIIALLLISTLLSILSFIYPFLILKIIVLISWILFILVINFFRDPERKTPDVHVNRAPVKGIIDYVNYNPGIYLPAFREKASLDNEQMSIGIVMSPQDESQKELKVMIKLIAGYIARRIVLWKKLHDKIHQGERVGMIKFGSRVEVYLPQEVELYVREGDKVKAGETIIAKTKDMHFD